MSDVEQQQPQVEEEQTTTATTAIEEAEPQQEEQKEAAPLQQQQEEETVAEQNDSPPLKEETATPQEAEEEQQNLPHEAAESNKEEVVEMDNKPQEEEEAQAQPTQQQTSDKLFSGFDFEGIPTETQSAVRYPPIDAQSVDIGGGVRRKGLYSEKLVLKRFDNISTCYESFQNSTTRFPQRPCLGTRALNADGTPASSYHFLTYQEVNEKVTNVASGMIHLGISPKKHVGIYSKNRAAWQISSEACHAQSFVSIALYDTLGEDSSLYIMNHGEIVCIFCSGEVLPKILAIAERCEHLKYIICFDAVSDENRQKVAAWNLIIHTMDELEEIGKKNPVPHTPPTPTDLATIMYTSGTTGTPKGVMLTHYNVVGAMSGVAGNFFQISEEDVLISYLPLAHILERVAELMFLQMGASIGFWQGNVLLLPDDLLVLQPTMMPAVPRVLDRFYDKVKAAIDSGSWLKRTLFQKAYAAKKYAQENGKTTSVWDAIVFKKVKARLGGRVRGMLSGGAPLRPEVHEFLRVAFDCPIIQGYGLTETCAAGTIQLPTDFTTRHIGPPLSCNEIKLESVPEMNYMADGNPPSGEICIRGTNVSIGYYKAPDLTAEVFDADGWFHTGDIGKWNPNGTITIVDRKKNIFKLSQGEYVASENVEQQLNMCQFLSRIWVYGDSFQSSLVGVGVVDVPPLVAYAKQNGWPDASEKNIETLIKDEKINKLILEDLEKTGKAAKLHGFEMVRAIHLVHQDFDVIDCVTPTMKLQRANLKKHFQSELDRMYANMQA